MRYLCSILFLTAHFASMALNAKSCGAKGDGIQDDSPYLNIAIAKALMAGEDLFIPSGTYKCNQLNTDLRILTMDQQAVKTIRIYGESGTKLTTSQSSGCILYIYYKCVNTTIENIFFESTHGITLNQTNAVILAGTDENAIQNFTIKNCRFEGFSTALSMQGVKGLKILNNYFESPKGHDNAQNNSDPAVYVWLADNINGQCYDVEISSNNVNGFTGPDINKTITRRPMDGFIYGIAYGLKVEKNNTRNMSEEHVLLQPQITYPSLNTVSLINNNNFYQAIPLGSMKEGKPLISNYGIRADCNNVKITDNDFYDYTLGVLILPFQYPDLNQHNYEILMNRFYAPKNTVYDVKEAIKVQAPANHPASDIVITNNYVEITGILVKSNRAAISVYSCRRVHIENNNVTGKNILFNGFLYTGILTQGCIDLITISNRVVFQ